MSSCSFCRDEFEGSGPGEGPSSCPGHLGVCWPVFPAAAREMEKDRRKGQGEGLTSSPWSQSSADVQGSQHRVQLPLKCSLHLTFLDLEDDI